MDNICQTCLCRSPRPDHLCPPWVVAIVDKWKKENPGRDPMKEFLVEETHASPLRQIHTNEELKRLLNEKLG